VSRVPSGGCPALAVDVGGTKVAAAVVLPDGCVVAQGAVPTRAEGGDGDDVFVRLSALVTDVLGRAGVQPSGLVGAGIGTSGPMDWPEGVVSPLNVPEWRGFPLRDRVAGLLRGVPVRLHNDAVCMTVGEHWAGAARDEPDVLGVVLSTGVGGGVISGGRLVDGGTGNAGHVGHVVVDPGGEACVCGGRGCLEMLASGPGAVRWALAQGWHPDGVADGRRLAEDADHDPVARAALRRAGRALGVALASVTAVCDLGAAVVGGGFAQAGAVLLDAAREALAEHAGMAFTRRLALLPAALGPQAGLVGAAALVHAGDRYWSHTTPTT